MVTTMIMMNMSKCRWRRCGDDNMGLCITDAAQRRLIRKVCDAVEKMV